MKSKRDFGLHVGQFLLDQLIRRQRPAELLSFQGVVACSLPAEFGGTKRTPGNAVARLIQAAERPLQSFNARQQILLGNENVVHDDFTGQ